MTVRETFDVVVVGGGPSGSTAAHDLAKQGRSTLLLERGHRIKPCGGAVPPRLIEDFDIPEHLIVARARSARITSPSNEIVDMPIDGGFVGMVDREVFDEWLRNQASNAGADRRNGVFTKLDRDQDGTAIVEFTQGPPNSKDEVVRVRARCVIGADGALSRVGRQAVPGSRRMPYVFAYHEVLQVPRRTLEHYDGARCEVIYNGTHSPDFYSWVFPHGDTLSIGTGSANKGFSLRQSVRGLRETVGLEGTKTIRCEGAPIPLRPLARWDNGKDVILAGDAAGTVAPASGEGIYYAMLGGRLVAESVASFLMTGRSKDLLTARKKFMKEHGRVFFVLGLLQYFWYSSDSRREQFVKLCKDPDIQRLTWDSYMHKRFVRGERKAHLKIFMKDVAHLFGLTREA